MKICYIIERYNRKGSKDKLGYNLYSIIKPNMYALNRITYITLIHMSYIFIYDTGIISYQPMKYLQFKHTLPDVEHTTETPMSE